MSQRYQREIEDLLGKLDDTATQQPQPKRRRPGRRFFAPLGWLFAGRGHWLSPGRVLLTALCLLLVALLFKASMPGFLAPLLLWGAVIVFILGYALFFINAKDPPEKRWRGQAIEGPPSTMDRLRRWLQGRR